MLIDWYTVAAQLLNFFILVALLKYFLYGKVVRAMERREQTIKDRLAQAEESKQEAEREAEVYRDKSKELSDSYTANQARMKDEIESHRRELLAQARQEIAHLQNRWREGLRQEQGAFIDELRRQASRRIFAIARQILRELADVDLEQQVGKSFASQLSRLDQSQWGQLKPQDSKDAEIVVYSRFPISEEVAHELRQVIQKYLGQGEVVRFESDPDLICGFELRRAGQAVSWSISQYLDELEESSSKVFQDELKETAADMRR